MGNPDPWVPHCGRETCFPCKTEPGRCMSQGIVYVIECSTCKAQGKESKYFGETAKTCYNRGAQHLAALKSGNKESPMVEHQEKHHPDTPRDFKMKVLSTHTKPLQRQSEEASLIEEYKSGAIMNQDLSGDTRAKLKIAD